MTELSPDAAAALSESDPVRPDADTASSNERIDLPHIILVVSVGVVLILLAVGNHLWDLSADFWSDLLLHLGAGTIFIAAVFLIEKTFVKHAEHAVKRFETLARQTSDRLGALDSRLDHLLANQDAADVTSASDFSENGTYDSLRRLLERARELDAISKIGVRVGLPETDLYVRMSPEPATPVSGKPGASSDDDSHILCALEKRDRSEVALFNWKRADPPDNVFLLLHDRLSQNGYAPSREQFLKDSILIRSALAHTLLLAVHSRSGDHTGLKPVGRIFQKVTDEWFVTHTGLSNIRDGANVTVEDLRSGNCRGAPKGDVPPDEWSAIVAVAQDAWRPSDWATPFW